MREYKQQHSGQERMRERTMLHDAKLGDAHAQEALESVQVRWNEWDCPRDGKMWVGGESDPFFVNRWLRK